MIVSLLTSMFDVVRFVSGFTAKNASIEHLNWSYIQRRGKNETDTDVVVFLHGFSSSKESWLRVARGIDKRYKIVIPDLPGQGRTTPIDILADYSMPSQAKRLHDFLEKEVPADKKIHLVGCSMGGMLAGVYAGLYPKRVKSLTMVCPAGISMPSRSALLKMLNESGRNLLLAHTVEDLDEMNKYLSYEPPKISKLVLNILASEREKQLPVLQKIIRDSLENPTVLEDLLPAIRARMLVMWGKHDQVLDVSSVDVLKKKWSPEAQGQVVLFDDCGHILHHEKYVECTAAINKFLSDCEKV
ncbi:serine protease family [Plasmopara halstedii]|uniref:Serine protease family n=1 Tax=Plasmopara halstedii TaxID=4781 RepID=A0A0P1AQU3_PLAHL|nr:serine protease family [Plasmopara halstedii]CEG43233.1 serine protease family [Plasmopara halstedii]|eukprot:XP_024579602.1 serine protease family [Plasmopara halstedii]